MTPQEIDIPKHARFSFDSHHQREIDHAIRSKEEFAFRDIYGKWPTTSELQQVWPYLKSKKTENA